MKRIFLLFTAVFTLVCSGKTFANNVAKGYYITLKNDTVYTTFLIDKMLLSDELDYLKLQYRVVRLDSAGEKVKLFTRDILEYGFVLDNENFIFRKCFEIIENKVSLSFLHLVKDGCIAKYKMYTASATGGKNGVVITHVNGEIVYSKNKGKLFYIPWRSTFTEDMSEWLKDCPEMVGKIKNKEYTRKDVDTIIEEYNSKCCTN